MRITVLFCIIISLGSLNRIYSHELADLQQDAENIWSPGLRPLCLGKETFINAQGSFMFTRNETDFAISGRGFFTLFNIETKEIIMTRNGKFSYNSDNYLVNHEGFYVLGKGTSPITRNYTFVTKEDIALNDSENIKPFIGGMKLLRDTKKKDYPFLILIPNAIESAHIMNSEYILFEDYSISQEHSIYDNFLEAMPLGMIELLEKTAEYFCLSGGEDEREAKLHLYSLLKTRIDESKAMHQTKIKYLVEVDALFGTITERVKAKCSKYDSNIN